MADPQPTQTVVAVEPPSGELPDTGAAEGQTSVEFDVIAAVADTGGDEDVSS